MQYSSSIIVLAFAATNVLSHGVIDSVNGANGVSMPGLSVIDGTPRDCTSRRCGAQADSSIIRDNGPPLGRTLGNGAVAAAPMVELFMSGTANKTARDIHARSMLRRSLMARQRGGGVLTPQGTVETRVAAAAGGGNENGLPTTSADGQISMTFHQVNGDGAGPLTAVVDPTSGGTQAGAFRNAVVTQNVPGTRSRSRFTTTDFPVTVQMPAGMTCSGTIAGVENACVVRLQNSAGAGPFGGSAVFTQSPAARKRAIEYNLAKRRFARQVQEVQEEADVPMTAAEAEEEDEE